MGSEDVSLLAASASEILSVMKYLCGEDEDICRLCFATTNEKNGYFLDDSVKVHRSFIDENLTFQDMFADLGVYLEHNLPQTLCIDCGTTVMNSYLFKKLCEISNKKWMDSLYKFEHTLHQADLINPNAKTAYLFINDKQNLVLTSKKLKFKNKSANVTQIKQLISNREKYAKLKLKKSFACGECGNKFATLQILRKHMARHQNVPKQKQQFACPHCAKDFATASTLQDHKERMHCPKIYKCEKCPKMFGSVRMVKQHEKHSHVAVICKICFIQLPSREDLQLHLVKHDDRVCKRCNKQYATRNTVLKHMKICGIKTEQIYVCDICDKKYSRKNGLRSHLKVDHGFGKVLSCNWCNKKFDVISKLKMHVIKHTREQNFFCERCGGKFGTKAALIYHTRIHTGERPFPCDLCSERFLSASRRMEHKRRKHFEPTKECSVCHAKFRSKCQLTRHYRRHFNPQSKLYTPALQDNLLW